jgi:hypothetical protein
LANSNWSALCGSGRVRLTKGKQVELPFACAAGGIDWEEDGPGNAAADEAYYHRDFQEAEEKVAVEGVVLQDVGIGNLVGVV